VLDALADGPSPGAAPRPPCLPRPAPLA